MNCSTRAGRTWARLVTLICLGTALASCGDGGPKEPPPPAPPPAALPPNVNFSAAPTSISLGQSSVLSWSSTNGSRCSATGAWSGEVAAAGSRTVTPTASGATTYTLDCSNEHGKTSRSVSLEVAPASAYNATLLVASGSGQGAVTVDARLINPWGIASTPTSPMYTANNRHDSSTLYDGNGRALPTGTPHVVEMGSGFAPTGIVYNASSDFTVSAGGLTEPATFVYSGESGRIAGWAIGVDPDSAITAYTATDNAVYKGLAMAAHDGANYLYATDFRNNKIDVLDKRFQKQVTAEGHFAFKDPELPAGYAVFGIQAITSSGSAATTTIYVTYARQAAANASTETPGAGLGLVNAFDTKGVLLRRVVSPGAQLDAPWGLALAPSEFGSLAGALLVGNSGDGIVHGFDPASGAYRGPVADAAGTPLQRPGLRGIAFGNDAHGQSRQTLFFAAGTQGQAGGVYGRADVGATPPVLDLPPLVTLAALPNPLRGTVTLSATVEARSAVQKVEFFRGDTSIGVVSAAPYTLAWDTTALADGNVSIRATATDADGRSGSSATLSGTIANQVAATLAQVQAQVFTPVCSSCHRGGGDSLPAVQNLSAGASFAAIVDVASLQQPALMRVKPGDPDNSYLMRKVRGAAGITGSRMPQGGNELSAAQLELLRSWIAAGARND